MEQPQSLQQQPTTAGIQPQPSTQTPGSPPQEQQMPQSPPTQESQKSPKRIIILIIVSILILGGLGVLGYFIINRESTPATREPTSTVTSTPTSAVETTPSTHYTGSQTINLVDVSGDNYSGTAARNIILSRATHSISTNLPDPPEGQFYQAWMIKPEEAHFNAGTLTKNSEGVYILETDFQFDPENAPFTTFDTIHNTIAISLEVVDDDIIETIILEGAFTK